MDIDHPMEPGEDVVLQKRKRYLDNDVRSDSLTRGWDTLEDRPIDETLQATEPDFGSSAKRIRLDHNVQDSLHNPRLATLPPEILQRIFSYVDHVALGNLMPVCRLFNLLLDPSKELPQERSYPGITRLQAQNDIWSISRRRYLPGFPKPMTAQTELEMWKLLRGFKCQFCGKKPKTQPSLLSSSPWNSGPGPEGVRAIWPFRVKSCSDCLEIRLLKDTELLLSGSSFLAPGLAFAIFTPSRHYVTSNTLRLSNPPPGLQLTKHYFRPHVEELENKLLEVRALGKAAAEEWAKGLEANGRLYTDDAARFEKWESTLAAHVQIGSSSISTPSVSTSPAPSVSSRAVHSQPASIMSPLRPFSAHSNALSAFSSAMSPPWGSGSLVHNRPPFPGFGQSPMNPSTAGSGFLSPQSNSGAPGLATPRYRAKHEKNLQEIDRLKSERRAEIERRCQKLDPPIPPSVLVHMSAFHSAVQIPMTLNENAWDVLKGRLLSQRGEAERKEHDQLAAKHASQLETEERRRIENQRRLAQEDHDRVWQEIEKPVRDKLKNHAEAYIASIWDGGNAVTPSNVGTFAANVLQHVKRQFYEGITEEDHLLASRGMVLPPNSDIHSRRKLKLEDMKWVFEEFIKLRLEGFGKDIFLCSACESTTKRYTFESVIQHYAAKHTSALSHGNIVVWWKADWPDNPPYHPDPESVWNRQPEQQLSFDSQYVSGPPGQPNGIYHIQCEDIVRYASETFSNTAQIRDLSDDVRLYVIIHQLANEFRRKYTNEPTLALFQDCVDHKPALRQLLTLKGLTCKACAYDGLGRASLERRFELSTLLEHFQSTHMMSNNSPPMYAPHGSDIPRRDWKFDMVDLPPDRVIYDLIHSPGMDPHKLEVIAAVFPEIFPIPLPRTSQTRFEQHQQPSYWRNSHPSVSAMSGTHEYDNGREAGVRAYYSPEPRPKLLYENIHTASPPRRIVYIERPHYSSTEGYNSYVQRQDGEYRGSLQDVRYNTDQYIPMDRNQLSHSTRARDSDHQRGSPTWSPSHEVENSVSRPQADSESGYDTSARRDAVSQSTEVEDFLNNFNLSDSIMRTSSDRGRNELENSESHRPSLSRNVSRPNSSRPRGSAQRAARDFPMERQGSMRTAHNLSPHSNRRTSLSPESRSLHHTPSSGRQKSRASPDRFSEDVSARDTRNRPLYDPLHMRPSEVHYRPLYEDRTRMPRGRVRYELLPPNDARYSPDRHRHHDPYHHYTNVRYIEIDSPERERYHVLETVSPTFTQSSHMRLPPRAGQNIDEIDRQIEAATMGGRDDLVVHDTAQQHPDTYLRGMPEQHRHSDYRMSYEEDGHGPSRTHSRGRDMTRLHLPTYAPRPVPDNEADHHDEDEEDTINYRRGNWPANDDSEVEDRA